MDISRRDLFRQLLRKDTLRSLVGLGGLTSGDQAEPSRQIVSVAQAARSLRRKPAGVPAPQNSDVPRPTADTQDS